MQTSYYFHCTRHKVQLEGTPFFSIDGEEDDIAKEFGDYLDEIDKVVEGITDEEIEERLRRTLEARKCQCKGLTACPCRPCENTFTQEDWLCDPCRLWKHDTNAQRNPHCHPVMRMLRMPYERTFPNRVPFPGTGKTKRYPEPDFEATRRYMTEKLQIDPEAIRKALKNWKGSSSE